MAPSIVGAAPVCGHCAAIFPSEWPRDRVLEAGSLNPVDCARHVLVFTRILYGVRLDKLHDECIVDSINWLRALRAASRTLRVLGVPRALFDLWTEQLHTARERLQMELRERPEIRVPGSADMRRALRTAMDAVGWEDFGISIDPDRRRIRILYTASQEETRVLRRGVFATKLRELLGNDIYDLLEIRFRQLED
jgi:hypothetical protein